MRPVHLADLSFAGPTDPRETHNNHLAVLRGARGELLRLSALEPDVVRVQMWPDGAPRLDRTWMICGEDGDVPREGRVRDDLSPFSCPAFERRMGADGGDGDGGSMRLSTGLLTVEVRLRDGRLRWCDGEGVCFAADLGDRAYAYDRAGRSVAHFMERDRREHYYGFGEKSGPLDKQGRRLRMMNLDALGYNAESGDPLYKHWPIYITYAPQHCIAYALIYDNLSTSVFDMGQEHDNYYHAYRYWQAEEGDVDYTLVYGPGIPQVVEKVARLIGRPALPPRWSLGYLGSTMGYTDAPDAQEQLKRFVELCAEHDIPCDLFHLSSGYTLGADGKRYVFTWNRSRIPDPPGMAAHFHAAGIHLAANIKPCLLTTHPRYAEVAALGAFVQAAEADVPEVNIFWGGYGSHLDFTNPAGYAWWQEQVHAQLLDVGIDATWNDNNEFNIWDDDARCHGFGQPLTIGRIRPLQPLLMTRASHEAQAAARPDERPYLITRSGCPGIQRYAQTWSGDNETSWHTLRYNIPMGLGMSLSGLPNIGHDVGGFTGYKPDPELFVRWVQNGIFHPRFTIHSWHLDGSVNEPWMYPEVLPLVREAIRLRYRLIPYLYTLIFEAARTGAPAIRPLVYHYPGDERCRTESFDFLLGERLLVASVLEPGARTRAVYLPHGDWCDWWTGQWHAGGQTATLDAPLERPLLLAAAGALIPLGRAMRHVGAQADDLRQLAAFPGPGTGRSRFTWVEDDGITLAYRSGGYTEVSAEMEWDGQAIALRLSATGGYPLPYRDVEIVLPAGETRPLQAHGATGEEWTDGEGRRHLRAGVATQVTSSA